MEEQRDRYINLFTDFGFKKLFGEEPNKDLLISFLNGLPKDRERITDLGYLKNEKLGKNEGERRAVYDLYCANERGEKLIVEIQRVKQEHFRDRSLYYSTFAIQEQALKGKKWNYELKAVYTIAILDFKFDDTEADRLQHRVRLIEEETCKVFNEKLTFIYLEIPKFSKEAADLETDYDKWLFAFKNLHKLREMPAALEEGIFKKLFEMAEILKLNPEEQASYQESLKDYRDLKNSMETYFKEGREEGLKEGLKKGEEQGKSKAMSELARTMLANNEPLEKIMQYTGLTRQEIEILK